MKANHPNVYKFLAAVALGAIGLVISSCGTVNGAGQDVKNTGRAIQRAAN